MKPSAEVEAAVLRLYESMATGDVNAIGRLFSRQSGALAIGSDPSEWWTGHDAIVGAFAAQLQAAGTRQISPGGLSAFAEGAVGWAADRRTIRLSNGKGLTVWETFVFHQEDGEWKIVQFHASFAVPNPKELGE